MRHATCPQGCFRAQQLSPYALRRYERTEPLDIVLLQGAVLFQRQFQRQAVLLQSRWIDFEFNRLLESTR